MNPSIKIIYTRYCGKFSYGQDLGTGIYEAQHWAGETLNQYTLAYAYIQKYATNISKETYKKYSKKRCLGEFNLAYCMICDTYLKNKPSKYEKIKRKLNIILKRKSNPMFSDRHFESFAKLHILKAI